METKNIQLFIDVSRKGSFAAVARDRNSDPSSISRTIASLEQQLGLRLFQRTTRKLVLTEAGEIYLNRIMPLLEEFEHAHEDARKIISGPSGTLRITTSVAFGQVCIVPVLNEFNHRFPEVKLDLLLTDSNLDIVADRIDLAIRLSPKSDVDLISSSLLKTRYLVCASPAYLRKHSEITSPADLQNHKCLVFSLPNYRSIWLFRDRNSKVEEIKINADISILSALALRECTVSGMGPALMADWLVKEDVNCGRLHVVLKNYEVTAESFDSAAWILYPSRTYLPHKVRVMIDFLKEKLSQI